MLGGRNATWKLGHGALVAPAPPETAAHDTVNIDAVALLKEESDPHAYRRRLCSAAANAGTSVVQVTTRRRRRRLRRVIVLTHLPAVEPQLGV